MSEDFHVPTPPPQTLDLFHRTTEAAARKIYTSGAWLSRENTREVYFSTRTGQHEADQNGGYGETVVWVRAPEEWAEIDDEFPSGEEHYRVLTKLLGPDQIVGWGIGGEWVERRDG